MSKRRTCKVKMERKKIDATVGLKRGQDVAAQTDSSEAMTPAVCKLKYAADFVSSEQFVKKKSDRC